VAIGDEDGHADFYDSADVLPHAGKPVKGEDAIRTVLTSVASAREQPVVSGPWIGGLPRDEWIVVAAASSNLNLQRCVELLDSKGIVNRLSDTGSLVVPVPLSDQARAEILANARWLRRPRLPQRVQPLPLISFAYIVSFPYVLICGLGALIIASQKYPDFVAGFEIGDFFLYFAALFAAFLAVGCVRPIARFVLLAECFVSGTIATIYKRFLPKRK
jgi:hypothetical protein